MKDIAKWWVPPAVAGILGYVSWHGELWGMALLPLLVYLWATAGSRWRASITMAAYFVVVARGLPSTVNGYWTADDVFMSFLRPAGYLAFTTLLFVSTWTACWAKAQRTRLVGFLTAVVLTSVPPIGLFGWASPLLGAGLWYPGFAWFGLALYAVLLAAIAYQPRLSVVTPFYVFCITLAVVANSNAPMSASPSFVGVDMALGSARDPAGEYDRLDDIKTIAVHASRAAPEGALIVLPEGIVANGEIGGYWLRGELGKMLAHKRQTLVLGYLRDGKNKPVNALMSMGAANATWENRVPVPASLWRPWDSNPYEKVPADWYGPGVQQIGAHKVASVICYEQLLIWPALVSFFHGADLVIAPSNLWFAFGNSLQGDEKQSIEAMGRLFGVPVISAINRR